MRASRLDIPLAIHDPIKQKFEIHINIDQGERLEFYISINTLFSREKEMIILRIPRKVDNRDLREYILNQIKKMRRNIKHKYIKLRGEVAYSRDYVFFVFPDRALELAFALSLLIKCQQHDIPCQLEISKSAKPEELSPEILECAKQWARRKLWRKCYKLKELRPQFSL